MATGQLSCKYTEVNLNIVYFNLKYETDKSGFERYLECQLYLNKEMFTVVSYKKDESGTQIEVQFSSTNQARYA